MKKQNFQQSLLAVGVIAALGLSGTAIAVAPTQTGEYSPTTNPTVTNQASATYKIGDIEQPKVESNEVTVTVAPVAQFSLVGMQGEDTEDNKNEDQKVFPDGTVEFKNKLTNEGNETDTFTLNLSEDNNNEISTDENDEFSFTNISDMTVQIYNDDDTKDGDAITVPNNGTVTLGPKQYAVISYTGTAPDSVEGGDTDAITLSATSKNIAAIDNSPSAKTLTNESQAIVTLPVFSIEKTAKYSNINLNAENEPKNIYTIKVTNDSTKYSVKADNILIQDVLPAGLDVDGSITVTSTNSNTPDGTSTIDTNGEGQKVVSVNGADLEAGETITIEIPVKVVDKVALAAAGSVTNNADVYDNYDGTPVSKDDPANSSKIHDSTDSSVNPNVPDDGSDPEQPGGDTLPNKVTFTDRSIKIADTGTDELPPTSGDTGATYSHEIANEGNQAESDLTVKITDNEGNPLKEDTGTVRVKNVKFDPTPEDPDNGDTQTLTPGPDGSYTLPEIGKGKKGKLTYDVVTEGAAPADYPSKVTVTATGDNAPEPVSKTDTTSVMTIDLVKEQAIDAMCDGTEDEAFTQNDISAEPGQCIIYKITATNPFAEKAMKDVIIVDKASEWNSGASFITDFGVKTSTDAAGTVEEQPASNAGQVKAKFATIPGTKSSNANNGWVKFSVKINN